MPLSLLSGNSECREKKGTGNSLSRVYLISSPLPVFLSRAKGQVHRGVEKGTTGLEEGKSWALAASHSDSPHAFEPQTFLQPARYLVSEFDVF
jgi:hypothetical protein